MGGIPNGFSIRGNTPFGKASDYLGDPLKALVATGAPIRQLVHDHLNIFGRIGGLIADDLFAQPARRPTGG
jgi:hypothetical protein